MGFAFKSTDFTDNPEDVRLVRGANIAQGGLKWGQERRFPAGRYGEFEKYHLRAADVVLAMDRPWIDAGLKWAVVSKDDVPALLVQRVARLRGTTTLAHEFVRYVIGSPEFEAYIQPIVTGVNVPHISGSQIEDFRFPLPPLRAQQKIAQALGGLDDLIENNRRRIEILEEMARLICREWFVHFRFPGHEDVKLVDSDFGPIPEGWRVEVASNLVVSGVLEIGDGYRAKNSEFAESGLAFVRVKNVRDGYLDLSDVSYLPTSYGQQVGGKRGRPGDCVISMKGTVGRMAFVGNGTPPLIYSPQVSYWRSHQPEVISPQYLRLWMQSPVFVEQCARVKGATDMADYVNLRDQRAMRLVVPSPAVHTAFVQSVSPLLSLADNLRSQISVLDKARNLLLPRLITGELDLSDLDLDLESVA